MWIYKNKEINDISQFKEGSIGFVYIIRNKALNKLYVGKKALFHKKTLPPLKGKKRKRVVVKESDWKRYMGSSKESMKWDKDDCKREILYICSTKTLMSYYEVKEILKYFEKKECINDNILGKFYKERIIDYIKRDK